MATLDELITQLETARTEAHTAFLGAVGEHVDALFIAVTEYHQAETVWLSHVDEPGPATRAQEAYDRLVTARAALTDAIAAAGQERAEHEQRAVETVRAEQAAETPSR